MEHVLDNPAWNALLSGNSNLALGTDAVKYFDADVSPFTGFAKDTDESFKLLYNMEPGNSPRGFISPVDREIPAGWKVLAKIKCPQMLFEGTAKAPVDANIIPLSEVHVPQMLALTKLTNPGPFAKRTIDFGHYAGIFAGDQLVAMAGQRMNPLPYAEISAVCTHPDHLGRGYAKQLLLHQAARIQAAGQVPILHVRDDNARAIDVYESLGFVSRKHIYFYIIQKV